MILSISITIAVILAIALGEWIYKMGYEKGSQDRMGYTIGTHVYHGVTYKNGFPIDWSQEQIDGWVTNRSIEPLSSSCGGLERRMSV